MNRLITALSAAVLTVSFALPPALCLADKALVKKDYRRWTMQDAVWMLNESPWARRETFTRVVGGVGSGVRGEKEILSTYFVRLLSALPIRQAYARIRQLHYDDAQMTASERRAFERRTARSLEMDMSGWIVVAIAFRSNNPDEELRFRQHFQTQTLETLRNTTFLTTRHFSQLRPVAYYPPLEEGVGAKFVFERAVEGRPVIERDDKSVTFEMKAPVGTSTLRSTFAATDMRVDGQWIF